MFFSEANYDDFLVLTNFCFFILIPHQLRFKIFYLINYKSKVLVITFVKLCVDLIVLIFCDSFAYTT